MINVHDRVLTMDFDKEVIKFNIFEAMRDLNNRCNELETPSDEFHYEGQKTETQGCNARCLAPQCQSSAAKKKKNAVSPSQP